VSIRRWLPSISVCIYLIAIVAAVWFGTISGERGVSADLPFLIALSVFPAVGWVISTHYPSNPLGWLFIGLATSIALAGAGDAYTDYILGVSSGIPAAAPYATWLSVWLWPLATTQMLLIVLLLPNGQPAGPKWGAVVRFATVIGALMIFGVAFAPGPLDATPPFVNPFGIALLEGSVSHVIGLMIAVFLPATAIAGAASLIVRFRRSHGDEREQLKWLCYGVCFMLGVILIINVLGVYPPDWLKDAAFGLGIAAVPIATGVAIFKYRLYDIDVIINQTLVYATLTAILGLAYFGIVVLLQQVFDPLTSQSDLAIAGSTLAVAALFRPLRSRVQHFIDRRFYRSKYDAQQTLEAFSMRLKQEVDLDHMASELAAVVSETVHPQSVSVWLRRGHAA
jgi:hypothetical protein